ncbi:tellurite resistance TerB family protein [Singulisphaera acidiphila]|uniref:Tellurite resistance protein TerB n=1 Tax=Singulisphaera acidiphila (strain ATCC BAA-1392 / DSM 18658 / VKM B-2454 / MOB10) TaxID=886293 RepID=L0DK73_SINAD|nr:hypothetical protein [Singulisphaera acidiphila]AGA29240.1 hypothetical protein Sinac_5088 [Singulisphaera acidiphila DSM 18658]
MRRQKPPGYEKWTWVEIEAGRRMSKQEKRLRRIAKSLNAHQRQLDVPNVPFRAPPPVVPRADANRPRELIPIAIHVAPRTVTPSPPIFRPLLGKLGRFLSSQWIDELPEWSQPIAWSLILTSPVVIAAIRWLHPGPAALDSVFCLMFMVVGAGAGGLVYDGLQRRRLQREEEESERQQLRDWFGATIIQELRTCPVRDFDFQSLATRCQMPRFDADRAAAAVYRQFSDRFVADGIITSDERRKLSTLAKVLEIGNDRVAVIEAAAKSDRFKGALDKVLADGVVTREESRELEQLRESLDLCEEDWRKAQARIEAEKAHPSSSRGDESDA